MENENNENIGIFILGKEEKIEPNHETYVIEDIVIGDLLENEMMVHVLTGDYRFNRLPTFDNEEIDYNVVAFKFTYDLSLYDNVDIDNDNISLNDTLKILKKELIGSYLVCNYEEGILKSVDVIENNHKDEIKEETISLKDISNKVKQAVINQDKAVDKVLANIVYNQKLYYSNLPKEKTRLLKKNMLIFGKTGTGKTEVIRQVLNNLDYNIPCIIEDANGYTIEGYKGKSVTDILRHLVVEANYNIEEAQHGIIIIDEIDKKLPNGDESEIASTGVLKSLLKIIEGGKFDLTDNQNSKFNGKIIDTSLITIILLGHFEKLYDKKEKNAIGFNSINEKEREKYTPEDFVKIGMIPEFMGIVGIITKTNDMDIETIKKIITDSNISPIMLEKKFYKALGTNITFDKESLTIMAQKALEKGTGARGIKSSYEEMIGNLSFDLLSGDIKEVSFEKGRARKRRYQTNEMERTI